MFRKSFVLMCLCIFIAFYSISYGDEMPFGYWNVQYNPDSSQQYIDMFEELGANQVVLGYHPAYPFVDAGIKLIRGIGQIGPYGGIYNTACYSIWQAEDDTSEIKFTHPAGDRGSDADSIYWVAPDSDIAYIFLDDLWYRQPNYEDTSETFNLPYRPELRIWADVDESLADSVIGYLRLFQSGSWDSGEWWIYDGRHSSLLEEYPIMGDSFITEPLITYTFEPYVQDSGSVTTYQLESTGLCTLKIDYLKISNDYGRQIMSGIYDTYIIDSLSKAEYGPDSLLAWELRDEPTPDMFLPYRHMDSLIAYATADTIFGTSCYSWNVNTNRCKSFLDIVESDLLSVNLYSFYGDCGARKTLFTGYDETDNTIGLQKAFDEHIPSFQNSRFGTRLLQKLCFVMPKYH